MKKILYLITQAEWGGAQKYIYDLATALSSRGIPSRRDDEGSRPISTGLPRPAFGVARNDDSFEILVAAGENEKGELFEKLSPKGIKTIYLKNLVRAINPLTDFGGLMEIVRLIRKERPDIIHLNSSKISVLGSLAAAIVKLIVKLQASSFKFQVIYTVHGWVFNEPLSNWQKFFYLWSEKITAFFKDKIICVSEYDRQIAIKNNFSEKKLITIHNGLSLTDKNFLEKEEAKKILNLPLEIEEIATSRQGGTRNDIKKTKIIGTIANFYPTKGLNYLIEAADSVRKKFPDILFVLIGEGQQKEFLNKKINQLNLQNNFKLVKIADAYRYLKAFDIFVLSSVKEGLPYTILEAMAAELPIVATRVGGIPEMIEGGVSGFLVEPKDSENLAKKISQMLENPDLAKNFGQNAKEKYEREFAFETMLKRTTELYCE